MFKKLSIFVLVLGFACFVMTQDTEQPNPDLPPLVSVTGRGRVRVQPDKVVFNVGVQQRGDTVEEVQDKVNSAAADIIAYLNDNGVDEKDVQTSYVSLSPYYTTTGAEYGSTAVDFYTATNTLTVTLRNVSQFDSLMSGLYEAGVNSVDNISFEVDDQQAQKQEAKRLAVAQAREIADALTEGLNVTVGDVYSVSDQDYDTPPVPIYFATAESGDSSIAGGEVEISQTVSVSFLIEN